MTITANLADGRVLNFPDGTDPAVIQATVKKMMAQHQPSEQAPAPASQPAPEPASQPAPEQSFGQQFMGGQVPLPGKSGSQAGQGEVSPVSAIGGQTGGFAGAATNL